MTPFCGGTIITKKHVLTAAHCTFNRYTNEIDVPSSIQVMVGDHDTSDNIEDRRDVATIKNHPKFNNSNANYDFSVLTLVSSLIFSSKIAPICLPGSVSSHHNEQIATVIGWGVTSSEGAQSPTLQKVDVSVLSNEKCKDYYPGKIHG